MERVITSLVQDTNCWGNRSKHYVLGGEFITTWEELHQTAWTVVSVYMLKEQTTLSRPRHTFLLCYVVHHLQWGSREGLLQDSTVTVLGQSQGTERKFEDGEEGYLELFHIRDNCDKVLRPVISALIIWHGV